MKRTLFLLITLATISSCNTLNVTKKWMKDNCVTDNINGIQIIRCKNLYPTHNIKQVCSDAVITYDVANATVEAQTKCGDSVDIVDLLGKVFKK